MIVRIFEVEVVEGREAEFARFFRETAMPLVMRQPGLESMVAGTPRSDHPCGFCMVMVWRDEAAIEAFAGPDWREAHVHPDEEGMVRARRVRHYALAE